MDSDDQRRKHLEVSLPLLLNFFHFGSLALIPACLSVPGYTGGRKEVEEWRSSKFLTYKSHIRRLRSEVALKYARSRERRRRCCNFWTGTAASIFHRGALLHRLPLKNYISACFARSAFNNSSSLFRNSWRIFWKGPKRSEGRRGRCLSWQRPERLWMDPVGLPTADRPTTAKPILSELSDWSFPTPAHHNLRISRNRALSELQAHHKGFSGTLRETEWETASARKTVKPPQIWCQNLSGCLQMPLPLSSTEQTPRRTATKPISSRGTLRTHFSSAGRCFRPSSGRSSIHLLISRRERFFRTPPKRSNDSGL